MVHKTHHDRPILSFIARKVAAVLHELVIDGVPAA
jgi:hypothetical protein